MPLVNPIELIHHAVHHSYALGYFEAWDGYSLEAVCEAAEAERSPVIIGFGAMMADRGWLNTGGLEALGALGRARAEACGVPVALIFNEAQSLEQSLRALDAGFNVVMPDTAALPWDEAVELVSALVTAAHARGVAVEAELGRLPDAVPGGIDRSGAALTDPEQAARFVAATGIDWLAVSIGNVHLLTEHEAEADLDLLGSIHRAVGIPLVIHGGTSFPASAVPEAIRRGAAKFNVGTALKRAFLNGARGAIASWDDTLDVHRVLGSHKPGDFLEAGKAAMREVVKERMRLYGSSGRAPGSG
jgi:ketose-bisphosphate aldolase